MRNMTTPCYKNIPTKELEMMATKNLIELMRYYDHNYNDSACDCYWGNCQCQKECVELRKRMSIRIYEILKTRPHIPNKIEAKKLRQERAAKRFKTVSAR